MCRVSLRPCKCLHAGTLVLWTIMVFVLMLCTFGIGAASGDLQLLAWLLSLHCEYEAPCTAANALPCHMQAVMLLLMYLESDMHFLPQSFHRVHRQSDRAQCVGFVSGIFIPSLTVGGAWGRLIGMLVQACLVSSGSSMRVSLPSYTVRPPSGLPHTSDCPETTHMILLHMKLTTEKFPIHMAALPDIHVSR